MKNSKSRSLYRQSWSWLGLSLALVVLTVSLTAQSGVDSSLPAPIKKTIEASLLWIWQRMAQSSPSEEKKITDPIYKNAFKLFKSSALALQSENKKPQEEESLDLKRLRGLLNTLRTSAADPSMRDCYAVHVAKNPIINALNTGCHIFMTTGMLERLNDQELRAVLAHEISHGDYGDSTRVILGQQSANSVDLEIRADQRGVQLLNRAGFSAEDLKSALVRLHELVYVDQDRNQDVDNQKSRVYPSLQKRLDAIDAAKLF